MKCTGYWVAGLLLLSPKMVIAMDLEAQLYQSCLSASPSQDSMNQKMCACQAQKWASGQIESVGEGPKTYLKIKQKYVEALIENWNNDIGIEDGATLEGEQAELAAIALNIGLSCFNELQNEENESNAQTH